MTLEHTAQTIYLDPEHTQLLGEALDCYQNTSHPHLAAAMHSSHAFSYGLANNEIAEPQVVPMDEGEVARRTNLDEDVYNMAFSILSGVWSATQSDPRKQPMEINIGNESAMAGYVTLALADELLFRLYPVGGQPRKPRLPHKRIKAKHARRDLDKRYRIAGKLYDDIYEINRRYLRRGVNGGWVNKVTTNDFAAPRLIKLGVILPPSTGKDQ